MQPRNQRLEVMPRYTPGSPAMLDMPMAMRIARQEKEAFPHYLEGVYGEQWAERALREGLEGIVIYRDGKQWVDAITDRQYGIMPYDAIRHPERLYALPEKRTAVHYFYQRKLFITLSHVEERVRVLLALEKQFGIDPYGPVATKLWNEVWVVHHA